MKVVLHHRHHGVLHVLLVGREVDTGVLLAELGGQLLDDEVGVADLLAVELDEGEESPLGPQFRVVVDVL